jgi:glyoxylase-like metal-dependent hydrolase (beta-lactamase superfamily II)
LSAELSYLPGHTQDGIVAFIPELGVLLGGDALETPVPLIYEDSPLSSWTRDLERWAQDTRVKTVIPSHGEIKDKALLLYNVAYLKAMQAGINFEIPYELDDFYKTAHARNQKISPGLE